jgi:DNA-binding NarL/FixJ family response regulator
LIDPSAHRNQGVHLTARKRRSRFEITPLEHRIIELVATGYTNARIASAMGLTHNGVKNRMRIIFDKAGVWNRLELALYFCKASSEVSAVRQPPNACGPDPFLQELKRRSA